MQFDYAGASLVGLVDAYGRRTAVQHEQDGTLTITGPGDLLGSGGTYRLTMGEDG